MSAAVFLEPSRHEAFRREPYRFPAGMLALAVHGAFFALLYFGFDWQIVPPTIREVELRESLPETVEAPFEKPVVKEVLQPVQPAKVAQPEIVLPEKKKIVAKRVEKKPVKKEAAAKAAGKKSAGQEPVEQDQDLLREEQRAERERAEQAEAKGLVVGEYKTKIQNKITRNIVMPPGVPDDALAVFRVTLLPDGDVMSIKLEKSSGNAAYDNAVERAILKSVPLPLPPDRRLFKDFRNLTLKFRPVQ